MSKRVLITGALGFAGRHVSSEMSRNGYEVYGIAHTADGGVLPDARETLKADIRDFAQLNEAVKAVSPTHVVHLAGITTVTHEDVQEVYDVNLMGSRNLLRALKELPAPPENVLLTSSATVYGISERSPVSEAEPYNPLNDYSIAKIGMEYLAPLFRDVMNIVIIRPFNYTGRGQSAGFLVPKVIEHFKRRADHIELGNTDVYRDFTDVRTFSLYVRLLLETAAAANDTFNICSGKPVSLREVLDICRDLTGHDIEVRINPKFQRPNEVKMSVGCPEKLHRTVGAHEDYGIRDTIAWMLED